MCAAVIVTAIVWLCPAAGIQFEYMEWRTTGTHILRALDDIQMLLDDQIVKTQSMRASPYIGPFEDRVRLWEQKLNLTQEIIDEWLKCQQVCLQGVEAQAHCCARGLLAVLSFAPG